MKSPSRNNKIFFNQPSQLVRGFWANYPEAKTPFQAILDHLAVWGPSVGLWNRIPTDLDSVLPRVGVIESPRSVPGLPVAGRLVPLEDGATAENFLIEVSAEISSSRMRFTLAHEIAHTFFRRGLPLSELSLDIDPLEEALCNFAAAEILVPRQELLTILAGAVPNINDLNLVRDRFQVSLDIVLIQVSKILRNRVAFLTHEVAQENQRECVRITRRYVGKKMCELRIRDPLSSLVIQAYRKQGVVDGWQRFTLDEKEFVVFTSSAPYKQRYKGSHILTILYLDRKHPHSTQRPTPKIQRSQPELKTVSPSLALPRSSFHCLSCHATGWYPVAGGVIRCACHRGILIDTPGLAPFLLVLK